MFLPNDLRFVKDVVYLNKDGASKKNQKKQKASP
jgi:hypothetical protein